ncbi:MAG: PEGA domain-containing protein, partial [Acidobacteriota bacterium]|nr:PEGA domain-containing protein [Acidobacteriota bacterium]
FYDPRFGPYPWWPPGAYPWYVPVYDYRAEVRTLVSPRQAAVYIDGFYAGLVDDFDGIFQRLYLPPGGHAIVFYLEGFRTARYNVYLRPASSLKLRHVMDPLPPGEPSEPPALAPPLPPPPTGTYEPPRTPSPVPLPAPAEAPAVAEGFGTLDLRVQPADAAVTVDGAPWVSSEPGHFVLQVAEGRHRVEVSKPGYRRYWSDIDIREGEASPLNVSLTAETQ